MCMITHIKVNNRNLALSLGQRLSPTFSYTFFLGNISFFHEWNAILFWNTEDRTKLCTCN